MAYGNKGEYDKAIADYTEAIRLDPKYAKAYYNRGWAYGEQGRATTRRLPTTPRPSGSTRSMPVAYYDRGNAYAEKGEYDKAIADYTEAIRLDPMAADAYHFRGLAYDNKGDHDAAAVDFAQARRLGYK